MQSNSSRGRKLPRYSVGHGLHDVFWRDGRKTEWTTLNYHETTFLPRIGPLPDPAPPMTFLPHVSVRCWTALAESRFGNWLSHRLCALGSAVVGFYLWWVLASRPKGWTHVPGVSRNWKKTESATECQGFAVESQSRGSGWWSLSRFACRHGWHGLWSRWTDARILRDLVWHWLGNPPSTYLWNVGTSFLRWYEAWSTRRAHLCLKFLKLSLLDPSLPMISQSTSRIQGRY